MYDSFGIETIANGCQLLEVLKFEGTNIHPKSYCSLHKLQNLTELAIHHLKSDVLPGELLEIISALPNLQRLSLNSFPSLTDSELEKYGSHFEYLESICLSQIENLQTSSLSTFPHLKSVHISKCKKLLHLHLFLPNLLDLRVIDCSRFRLLTPLPNLSALYIDLLPPLLSSHRSLKFESLFTQEKDEMNKPSYCHLTRLEILECPSLLSPLPSAFWYHLFLCNQSENMIQSFKMSHCDTILLTNNSNNHSELAEKVASAPPQTSSLRDLTLAYMDQFPKIFQHYFLNENSIPYWENIQKLSFEGTTIKDNEMKYIGKFMINLMELNLKECHFLSDAAIGNLKSCKQLSILHLGKALKLSSPPLLSLKSLTKLYIQWYPKNVIFN